MPFKVKWQLANELFLSSLLLWHSRALGFLFFGVEDQK